MGLADGDSSCPKGIFHDGRKRRIVGYGDGTTANGLSGIARKAIFAAEDSRSTAALAPADSETVGRLLYFDSVLSNSMQLLFLCIPFHCTGKAPDAGIHSPALSGTGNLGDIIQKLQVTVDTIYFGGGTPTSISAEALEQLLQTVVRVFDLSKVREFCVEAGRPDTITREKLEVLKRYGVDRISVNPQTMEDAVLQQIGRKHTSAQIAEAFQLAREVGFTNINMDLIAGLPHDTPEGFHRTLKKYWH